jgi:predicted transcriptional regulator
LGKGDPQYRAAHLGLDHWNNIPAESGLWKSYNLKSDRRKCEKIYSKIMPMLKRILSQYLTPRQFEVMKLCLYEPYYTQSATAHLLGISQPTVSQHLNGKKRNGKKVGGARPKIQRKIRTILVSQGWSVEERHYLDYLQSFVRSDLSHRQRQQLFRTLP